MCDRLKTAVRENLSFLPYEVSEFKLTHLTPIAGQVVRPSRIAESPIAFECRTIQVVSVGSSNLVIGEVVHTTIQDELIDEQCHIDSDRLQAIGRMAGSQYCRTQNRFEIRDEKFFP